MTEKPHAHPSLRRPISEVTFRRNFQWAWVRAYSLPLPEIIFADHLSKRHAKCARNYAEVDVRIPVFYFAKEVLYLPKPHRLGLIAHEIGHYISPGSEAAADKAAKTYLGVEIGYDQRWPTDGKRKGLQYAKRIL